MKAHLVSLMVWAPEKWSDDAIVEQFTKELGLRDELPEGVPSPLIKSISIAPDQVAMKAHVIFGERIDG